MCSTVSCSFPSKYDKKPRGTRTVPLSAFVLTCKRPKRLQKRVGRCDLAKQDSCGYHVGCTTIVKLNGLEWLPPSLERAEITGIAI